MRETIIVPESKKRIEKIKNKYKNIELSNQQAEKIYKLEVTNNILKTALALTGIVTAVDLIIPDPLPLLDEAILSGLTILFSSSSALVDNKINQIANSEDASLQMSEINKLSSQLINVANAVNAKRSQSK